MCPSDPSRGPRYTHRRLAERQPQTIPRSVRHAPPPPVPALRVFVAYVVLPQSGLRNDMGTFAAWAFRMAELGPGGFGQEGSPTTRRRTCMSCGCLGKCRGSSSRSSAAFRPSGHSSSCRAWSPTWAWRGSSTSSALPRRPARHAVARLRGADRAHRGRRLPIQSRDGLQLRGLGPDGRGRGAAGRIYCLGRGWTEAAGAAAVLAILIKFQFGWLIPIVLVGSSATCSVAQRSPSWPPRTRSAS